MVQADRQHESLETLKLINAAATTLRLYPGDFAKVTSAIETAYQGTKAFLRENHLLRFSCREGEYLLNGVVVDSPTRERIQVLTFHGQLRKMGLEEFVLCRGFDRTTFKKILSVFGATPEQIHKVGGNRAFIENLGLGEVFPEHYFAPGESDAEIKQKRKVDKILKELSAGMVRPEFILYLVGRKKEESLKRVLELRFQSAPNGAHVVATTTFSLLQTLFKSHLVVASPVFPEIFRNIGELAPVTLHEGMAAKAAGLLAPYLDQCSVLMLICQDFGSPFGQHFFHSLLAVVENGTLASVLDWIKGQQEQGGEMSENLLVQLKVVSRGYQNVVATPRGKQILALSTTREVLQKTEQGRKEKRVQVGINALAHGDLECLRNKEVRRSLPATIEKLLEHDKGDVAAAIIQNVVMGLKEQDHGYRLHLAQVIGDVSQQLAIMNRWDWLEKLTPVCLAWIRESEVVDKGLKNHVMAMQAMMNHAWYFNNTDLAERILNVFYYIRSGALEKSDSVRRLVGYIQDKNVDLALLQGYLERCFVKPVDEMICRKIVMQGPVAARFLLDTLITSEKRSDRIRLLKILSEMGGELVPVLLERLPDAMPWFGKRNIIRLLAETGSSKDLEAILHYAAHDDLRVQLETVQCIVRIGKTATRRYLLQVLGGASVQAKTQVVMNLRRIADESVVPPLAALIEECRLYHGPEKAVLTLEISRTLRDCGSPKALVVLQTIVTGGEKQFGKGSIKVARLAITYIQGQLKGGGSLEDPLVRQGPPSPLTQLISKDPVVPVTTATDGPLKDVYALLTGYPEEQEVYALLARGNKDAAKEVLVQLVEKMAHLKRFAEAEALRLRLIDIDPMALAEIIKTAEIIEEAKSNAIDKDHILIWSDLYDLLTTEEFNAFYHSLVHEIYATETLIVKQGDPQWRLFFVNRGRVKLFFNDKDDETLVKTIGYGDVFGAGSFFDDSVWTLNAASMGTVEASTLSMKCVEEWGDAFPALEAKLHDYCVRFGRVNDFFLSSGAERRRGERHPLSGTVYTTLLNEEGVLTDTTIRGDCSDLSIGGISFLARINVRQQARTLLGRHVKIFFKDDGEGRRGLEFMGTVVAVRNLHSVELGRSVHIRFDQELSHQAVMDIIVGK